MLRRTLLSLCLLSVAPLTCAAPEPIVVHATPFSAPALDALVSKHLGTGFNGVVLVRRSSDSPSTVVTKGMADFEKDRPIRSDTAFQIGSISKWLSAVTVLRLVDQHKLDLDVPIGVYLPELPPATGKTVTLRHLLSNTSGIPNGVQQEFKKDKSVADLQLNHVDAALRFGAGAPMFTPGTAWEYSPTGWIVAAAIIERVTGAAFADVVESLLLAPAGAASTGVPRTPFKDMPAAAIAYRAGQPRVRNMTPHIVFISASGTVYSTAADLVRLADAVYATPFLSPGSRDALSRISVPVESYALGGRVKMVDLGGQMRSVAWETGATGASKSLLAYVPGEGKAVVILNNTDMPQGEIGAAAEALLKALYH